MSTTSIVLKSLGSSTVTGLTSYATLSLARQAIQAAASIPQSGTITNLAFEGSVSAIITFAILPYWFLHFRNAEQNSNQSIETTTLLKNKV